MKVEHLIKDMENGCPVGHKCDACNLYMPLYKRDKDGELVQRWDCSLNNLVRLQAESKDRILGVQQAVESARNENIQRQDTLLRLVNNDAGALPSK